MRHRGQTGLRLLAAGLALVVLYAGLVWYAVFENEDDHQVCGEGTAHRDNFFPPYTACGTGADGYRMTSDVEMYIGSALFLLAAGLVIVGAALLISGTRGFRNSAPVDEYEVGPPSQR